MAENGKLRIAAMGDLHVHEVPPNSHRDVFVRVSEAADVLLLCGDLTHFGAPAEAKNLLADLQNVRIPTLGVLGNHDHESGRAAEVRQILREKITFIDEEPYECDGTSFVGVKGFCGGFDTHLLTPFGEEATKLFVQEALNESLRLENLFAGTMARRYVVALHYAPIAETVIGEPPEIFPFLGCSRMAEVIDRFPVEVVFHGHAHHGAPEGRTRKGIPVFNCCEALLRKHDPDRLFVLFELDRPGESGAIPS